VFRPFFDNRTGFFVSRFRSLKNDGSQGGDRRAIQPATINGPD
jgi:hypothetical protein